MGPVEGWHFRDLSRRVRDLISYSVPLKVSIDRILLVAPQRLSGQQEGW